MSRRWRFRPSAKRAPATLAFLLAGGWNARVGQKLESEEVRVLGRFAFADRAAWGPDLVDWALRTRVAILDTQFRAWKHSGRTLTEEKSSPFKLYSMRMEQAPTSRGCEPH